MNRLSVGLGSLVNARLDPTRVTRYTGPMRRLLVVALLLVQFGPLAGAGLCLHAAAQPKGECSMPMKGMRQDDRHSQPSSSQDCAQMAVCTPAAPMVAQVAVQLVDVTQPSYANFSTPSSLRSSEPIAPPQPPPIS